ncbi:probable H/ACA ribonucleoprotein complex subunit 1 [Penaeus japonicus]|uniref:probable H/ACA ribonucleoprotein complex subunit 1 n=1 Tax=Penaeus japonicus TaxID=27405 RepID=UPI001C70E9BA|nr:probable H/ACA ribonucleoprotein complex subunit 1 [Penaeus japonicus]
MTTTTTVAVGGLGLGLGAAALAGAVGLGLAAVAFGGRNRGGNKGGYRGGYGHHGGGGYGHHGGGGYGHHGGYGGYHRRRRSVEDESEALDNLMALIRQEDVTGCGLKLMCELGAAPEDELTVEELSIMHLVGPIVKPGEGVLPSGSATTHYRDAKTFGQEGGECAKEFPMCPLNRAQLMETVMNYLP